ncbi:MAG: hypothetical protein AB4042_01950 [Leptolyngbyaceae cyanobacterium]
MEQHLESTVNSVPGSAPQLSGVEAARASATQSMTPESYRDCASKNTVISHQLPIPPASEPMQYRAIGLIQGTYVPSDEQFTRGTLMTEDDQPIDAVLLGRVMSLVKKHVDLTAPHLWVVYPRTRPKNEHLHAQIVGIWEPDKLHPVLTEDDEEPTGEADEAASDIEVSHPSDSENLTDADSETVDPIGSTPTGDDEASEYTPEQATLADPMATGAASDAGLSEAHGELPSASQDGDAGRADNGAMGTEAESDSTEEGEASPSDDEDASAPKLVKPARPKFSAAAAQAANSPVSSAPEQPPVSPPEAPASSQVPTTEAPSAQPILKDGYFSVRGEVIQFSPEDEQITVRIRQASRKGGGTNASTKAKSDANEKEFKLHLQGRLEGRTVGYFWELQVQRQGNDLVVFDSNMIGVVPPRKNRRKKGIGGARGGRGGIKRRFDSGRPTRPGDRPAPAPRRVVGTKPVLKKNSTSNTGRAGADE